MGVVNVTPDSFSDGGVNLDPDHAIASGIAMAMAGAAMVDVGGESTRPGATPVPVDVEISRVRPVVEGLASAGVMVSIDTSKPEVAAAALEAGAEVINDVTAFAAPGMAALAAGSGAGVVLMHMKGTPTTMQADPSYVDVVEEVRRYLLDRVGSLLGAGVAGEAVAIDPGIGFGKTVEHNLELIAGLGSLAATGHPVVLGASRKSFLGTVTGIADPVARDGVTAVITALGFERGARVFRVHDVAGSVSALRVAATIVAPEQWDAWQPDSNPGVSPGS